VRYFITSLKPEAERLVRVIRDHWGVESVLHWSLDVTFKEDQSRIRKENSPQNFAAVRRLVLNLLRKDPNPGSLRTKRKLCALTPRRRLLTLLGKMELIVN
jgi:predicted transposase YbfD/YdcC